MSQTFRGHCHCKAVEWQVELPSDSQSHILCHCEACKLQSGGEFTLNQLAPKDAFKLTKGDLKVYTYKGDSGNPVDCYFCANCTSSPYHHQHALGDKIVVRTMLLHGSKDWGTPALEIFGKDKLNWQPQTAKDILPAGP
ncbi:hypothetical protein LTS08_005375 [Lithohypha guttulata]|uniref:CENP-V/GFA domain-containing protein n=1 Tax=Lithohypha guttulata TaxID=1690604 RepID=A0AAN7T709_9EURO|nr:hypothetical protein LTR51_008289 [Lithohypha guttulata]KAK5091614.1 hypothetical protein LTR05_001799 [Lithohypha guttulata]KAK5100624.1 hypothetical protein LTS08_005375 [Lithohypha guttulata]